MAGLLGAALRRRVTEVFERNQITTSVASEAFEKIAAELQALDTAIDRRLASFAYFDVQREEFRAPRLASWLRFGAPFPTAGSSRSPIQ